MGIRGKKMSGRDVNKRTEDEKVDSTTWRGQVDEVKEEEVDSPRTEME